MRRIVVPLLLLVFVLAGTLVVVQPFARSQPEVAAVPVTRGTIESTVELAGTVAARAVRRVTFGTAGTIARVAVTEADRVAVGQELAVLGAGTFRAQVAAAEASLAAADSRLAADRAGPTAAQRTAAYDAVAQAKQAVAAARTAERDIRRQQDNALDTARKALAAAEARRDADLALPADPATIAGDEAAVEQARSAIEAATLARDATLNRAAASVDAARGALRAAQHAYAVQTAPAPPALISANEAAVAAARAGLIAAEENLERATIRAPIAGTITHVGYAVGDHVVPVAMSSLAGSGSSPAGGGTAAAGLGGAAGLDGAWIEISDLSELVVVAYASEMDVASLSTGDVVAVTLDALSGLELAATVCQIGLTATGGESIVGYEVRFCPFETDARLRSGMTATVRAVVARSTDALIVPTSAVRRSGDGWVARVLDPDGTTREIEVELGVTSGSRVEIVSGLVAGDEVVVPSAPPAPMTP